jgi:hypothetical protein
VFAWVAGSLGVLVGSLVAAHDRVTGICVLASLLMAALGGCWWPLEIGPPVMKTISLCLPTGWALQALHQLISFGSGFDAVWLPLAVLAGFGAAANLLAARFSGVKLGNSRQRSLAQFASKLFFFQTLQPLVFVLARINLATAAWARTTSGLRCNASS